jgi:2,3-bisphosphoglycerate-independent phosphoglycerate mutase
MVLDGFGCGPTNPGNAIRLAKMPNLESYFSYFPSVSLQAAGISVGLPWGDPGNSEVGHTIIGAGTILYQNEPRINMAIDDKSFFENKEFKKAAQQVKQNKSAFHIIGLVSPGGVHASFDHCVALLEFAKQQELQDVFVHVILDGRDAPYNSGYQYVSKLLEEMKRIGIGKIASLSGRYYAMDRNNNWDRIEKAYNAIAEGVGTQATDPLDAIQASYARNIFDEEFEPAVIMQSNGAPLTRIQDGDAAVFFNFRADRARELTKAIALPGFEKFNRARYIRNLYFVTMTEYEEAMPVQVAFPNPKVDMPISKVLSDRGFRQLHVAETEKYAHVTYFFNGGEEKPFLNEDRILVPSKPVTDYSTTPAMSAYEITDKTFDAVKRGYYDFVVMNYANADMIGHTGNLKATIEGLEALDGQIGRLTELVTSLGGVVFITADHGNAEQKIDPQTGEISKEHTTSPVPFVMISPFNGLPEAQNLEEVYEGWLSPAGILADVAPTILDVMGVPKPVQMSGTSLLSNLMPQNSANLIFA